MESILVLSKSLKSDIKTCTVMPNMTLTSHSNSVYAHVTLLPMAPMWAISGLCVTDLKVLTPHASASFLKFQYSITKNTGQCVVLHGIVGESE